jgi:two-component system, cell cycle response regulator DivK
LSAKHILIVDDNPNLRQILADLLARRGYTISAAATGKEAIQLAINANPKLILLDLMLPDMSGIDVVRALRKNHQTAQIPIVGCTAYFGPEWRDKAFSAGISEYLEKPLPLSKIEAVIEQQLVLAKQPKPNLRERVAQTGKIYLSRKFQGIKFSIPTSVAFLRAAALSFNAPKEKVNAPKPVRANSRRVKSRHVNTPPQV